MRYTLEDLRDVGEQSLDGRNGIKSQEAEDDAQSIQDELDHGSAPKYIDECGK